METETVVRISSDGTVYKKCPPQARSFDYVKYDEVTAKVASDFKDAFQDIENRIIGFSSSRAKSLALTKLEEAYMWVGKMLRDEQVARTGQVELQEERTNS